MSATQHPNPSTPPGRKAARLLCKETASRTYGLAFTGLWVGFGVQGSLLRLLLTVTTLLPSTIAATSCYYCNAIPFVLWVQSCEAEMPWVQVQAPGMSV